jgi:hypothetical protein
MASYLLFGKQRQVARYLPRQFRAGHFPRLKTPENAPTEISLGLKKSWKKKGS